MSSKRTASDSDGAVRPATTGEPSPANSDLKELEHLVRGFSDELTRLNEALGVMGAYIERMRRNAARQGTRLLH